MMKKFVEVEKMLRSESEIKAAMIETLKAQIEAVETDDEAQYIVNNAKQMVYAYVLQLNVYGRDFMKENYKKRGAVMRDDLISRKALLDSMDKRYKDKFGIVQDNLAEGFMQMEKLIKEQPTAYDVEKVVKKIKELPTHTFETYSQGYPMDEDFVDPCDVIKIVKSGGVADD